MRPFLGTLASNRLPKLLIVKVLYTAVCGDGVGADSPSSPLPVNGSTLKAVSRCNASGPHKHAVHKVVDTVVLECRAIPCAVFSC